MTQEEQAAMARRMAAEHPMHVMQPNQQVEVLELDSLTNTQMKTIVDELGRSPIDVVRAGGTVLPIGPRRDSLELAWYSGRLTRDGKYPRESTVPEGKAVETYLAYDPATGSSETWPPVFLPGLSPQIENGSLGGTPLPMFYEMRVDAKAEGAMQFAVLVSMGGKKMLVPAIKVKSGEAAKIAVPGGHTLAIHATLRDQTERENEEFRLLTAARAEGQQAFDEERVRLRTTLPPGIDPSYALPPEIVERLRTTAHRESAIRAIGAKP